MKHKTVLSFDELRDEFSNSINKSTIIEWHKKLKNVDYQIKASDNPRLWLEIHLTSLLDKDDLKNIDKNIKINRENKNQRDSHTNKFGQFVRSHCVPRGAFSHCKFGNSPKISVLKFGAFSIISAITVG